MTCHCSSPHEHSSRAANYAYTSAQSSVEQAKRDADAKVAAVQRELAKAQSMTPDATRFDVEDLVEVGPHAVLKVRFPNCAACAYEGVKVLVYLNVKALDIVRWKKLDPHFRAMPKSGWPVKEAPSPAARFPASDQGWKDALAYANAKTLPPVTCQYFPYCLQNCLSGNPCMQVFK